MKKNNVNAAILGAVLFNCVATIVHFMGFVEVTSKNSIPVVAIQVLLIWVAKKKDKNEKEKTDNL